jgi:hypothetical protein
MSGEPVTKGKDTRKAVSVKDAAVPKIKKALGGEAGEAICEGLQLVESTALAAAKSVRSELSGQVRVLRTEASAANKAATEARERANESVDTAENAVSIATAASEKVAEAEQKAEAAASKSDVQELDKRVKSVEADANAVKRGLTTMEGAMACEVETTDGSGKLVKQRKSGAALLTHIMDELRTNKDALGGFGEQVEKALQTAEEALARAGEAGDLIETAKQMVQDVNEGRIEDSQKFAQKLSAAEDAASSVNGGADEAKKKAGQALTIAQSAEQKLDRVVKTTNATLDFAKGLRASLQEAVSNIDGKIQLLAMMALGDAYGGEIEKELEKPSLEEKG